MILKCMYVWNASVYIPCIKLTYSNWCVTVSLTLSFLRKQITDVFLGRAYRSPLKIELPWKSSRFQPIIHSSFCFIFHNGQKCAKRPEIPVFCLTLSYFFTLISAWCPRYRVSMSDICMSLHVYHIAHQMFEKYIWSDKKCDSKIYTGWQW